MSHRPLNVKLFAMPKMIATALLGSILLLTFTIILVNSIQQAWAAQWITAMIVFLVDTPAHALPRIKEHVIRQKSQ